MRRIKSPLKKLFTPCLVVIMLTCSISFHAYAAICLSDALIAMGKQVNII